LQAFLAAVNRSDHDDILARMLPAQRPAREPRRVAGEFPEYIAHCEILRLQITQVRSGGPHRRLGKVLVRLEFHRGTSLDYVFLLADHDRVWKIDNWLQGDSFDLLDYTVH
jgi:hypothetical protein